VFNVVKEFYEKNKGAEKVEEWFLGNTYTNHWESPSYLINFEDTTLRGGGPSIKQRIWDAAKSSIEEWTGQELKACSLYGVRVYKEGALLAPHVDRLPLVASAILNVAQDVDEPWPIEVIGHDGYAHNITMEPGEMILYESHSIIHGRPFPLKGRTYANVFIHFEPVGHSLYHHGLKNDIDSKDVNQIYKDNSKKGHAGHEHSNKMSPIYVKEGSPWESHWFQDNAAVVKEKMEGPEFKPRDTEAAVAAQDGDLKTLNEIASLDQIQLIQKDKNGWEPIHEAARFGNFEIVKFLVDNGVDVNERTEYGYGVTPLAIALETHDETHDIVRLLRSIDAVL